VADLLSALKDEGSFRELISSPHLFGVTSVICGAVGRARASPILDNCTFKYLKLSYPILALKGEAFR